MVSGAAALVVQQRPTITPDQVKRLLMTTAQRLPVAHPSGQGWGMLDLKRARDTATPTFLQNHPVATGTGSLELARGITHVENASGATLSGERDAFGGTWDGRMWSGRMWSGTSGSGGTWSGRMWSGGTWNGRMWSGSLWSSGSWTGRMWSGSTWSGGCWSGRMWSGRMWSGGGWM